MFNVHHITASDSSAQTFIYTIFLDKLLFIYDTTYVRGNIALEQQSNVNKIRE